MKSLGVHIIGLGCVIIQTGIKSRKRIIGDESRLKTYLWNSALHNLFLYLSGWEERAMKVKVTCQKCGYAIEKDFKVVIDTNQFAEALKFLQEQAQKHHHPEVNDSFKWRLGWEG